MPTDHSKPCVICTSGTMIGSTVVSWYRDEQLQLTGHFVSPLEACVHAIAYLEPMRAKYGVDRVSILNERATIATINLGRHFGQHSDS